MTSQRVWIKGLQNTTINYEELNADDDERKNNYESSKEHFMMKNIYGKYLC